MHFTSPPNQDAYYAQVWDLVRQVPYGKVVSYGQIAKMLPPPQGVEIEAYAAFGPRWVGGAMAFVTGYLSLVILRYIVLVGRMWMFAIYLLPLGFFLVSH